MLLEVDESDRLSWILSRNEDSSDLRDRVPGEARVQSGRHRSTMADAYRPSSCPLWPPLWWRAVLVRRRRRLPRAPDRIGAARDRGAGDDGAGGGAARGDRSRPAAVDGGSARSGVVCSAGPIRRRERRRDDRQRALWRWATTLVPVHPVARMGSCRPARNLPASTPGALRRHSRRSVRSSRRRSQTARGHDPDHRRRSARGRRPPRDDRASRSEIGHAPDRMRRSSSPSSRAPAPFVGAVTVANAPDAARRLHVSRLGLAPGAPYREGAIELPEPSGTIEARRAPRLLRGKGAHPTVAPPRGRRPRCRPDVDRDARCPTGGSCLRAIRSHRTSARSW